MLNIAIIGATGLVGQALIKILETRNFPVKNLYLLASSRSIGESAVFKNKALLVQELDKFDFKAQNVDIAFFSAGGTVSAKYAPLAAKTGCIVIDNTSNFRYDQDIPLIIPEVNPEDLIHYKKQNIIANPNCATIQALVAIKPIYDLVGISKINFVTYQSVSGTGRKALEELIKQTTQTLSGQPTKPEVYPKQIAFNILPHIDIFYENGYSKEELKMVWETHKLLHDDSIKIIATTARTPTLHGHSVAIHLETKQPIKASLAKKILTKAPGISVIDGIKNNRYPTIIPNATDTDQVSVGRIRNFLNDENGLAMWVVADNIRKGAALNAIQIAEMLLNKRMLQ
jgi:aspartate-semialdehyde dehydrogenase